MKLTVIALVFSLGAGVSHGAAPPKPNPTDLVRQGEDLYRRGLTDEALLKFEQATAAGAKGGQLFYEMGYCYRIVRQDAAASKDYMTRAVPLLEAQVASNPKTPAPYYFLAAIHYNELKDGSKGAEFAKKGIERVEAGAFKSLSDGESLFQIATLYSLAGDRGKALPFYLKAATRLEADINANRPSNRQYFISAASQLADQYLQNKDYGNASEWFLKLSSLDPNRDQQRMSFGKSMILAGRYSDALKILGSGFTNDDLATEATYTIRVVSRYLELGSPPPSPDWAGYSDTALEEAISKSAEAYSMVRQKEEPPAPTAEEQGPEVVERTTKSGEKIKFIRPREWVLPVLPPPSAERIAAEKEMFGLMLECLRRGRSIRDLAYAKGFSGLMFR